jgi:cytochrome c oxidase assembly protein subunit 15
MRHQHAGLAIPDFPLAYGRLWPAMDTASVAAYNQHRMEVTAVNPITPFQIGLQMVHRFLALAFAGAVFLSARSASRVLGRQHMLSRLSLAWLGLILVQALLGAASIWTNKAADIATAHVLVGALSLATGTLICLIGCRHLAFGFRSSRIIEALHLSPLRPEPVARQA